MSLRIDKFIWHVRLSKTRSIAAEWVQKGKIKLNHALVKPSKEVQINDIVTLSQNNAVLTYQILDLPTNRIGAKLVASYILNKIPEEELEKLALYQTAQKSYRTNGNFKPSKKERAEINSFLDELV